MVELAPCTSHHRFLPSRCYSHLLYKVLWKQSQQKEVWWETNCLHLLRTLTGLAETHKTLRVVQSWQGCPFLQWHLTLHKHALPLQQPEGSQLVGLGLPVYSWTPLYATSVEVQKKVSCWWTDLENKDSTQPGGPKGLSYHSLATNGLQTNWGGPGFLDFTGVFNHGILRPTL